jgi:hypothetical protein
MPLEENINVELYNWIFNYHKDLIYNIKPIKKINKINRNIDNKIIKNNNNNTHKIKNQMNISNKLIRKKTLN